MKQTIKRSNCLLLCGCRCVLSFTYKTWGADTCQNPYYSFVIKAVASLLKTGGYEVFSGVLQDTEVWFSD